MLQFSLMTPIDRPETTLILLASADGCSLSHDSIALDLNKSWKESNSIKSIIYQFFDFANNTDFFNVVTGESVVQMGVNRSDFNPKKSKLRLVVMDVQGMLTPVGIKNLSDTATMLIVVVSKNSPSSRALKNTNLPKNCHLEIVTSRSGKIDLTKLSSLLRSKYNVKKLTIQSSSIMSGEWLNSGVVDHLTLIVYPLLVGNNGSPSIPKVGEFGVRSLILRSTRIFDGNYICHQYDLNNEVLS